METENTDSMKIVYKEMNRLVATERGSVLETETESLLSDVTPIFDNSWDAVIRNYHYSTIKASFVQSIWDNGVNLNICVIKCLVKNLYFVAQ
jgi:hypothetical protein